MDPIHITIAGMGPRGLSVLERMLEHAHRLPSSVRLQIDVVDPRECGQGSHPSDQPEQLLINTLASQVTMFAPVSRASGSDGVSLLQWARASGYRRVGARFMRVTDSIGTPLSEFDHLPRSLLGEYLSWVFSQIVTRLPANVRVSHRRSRVVDLAARGNRFDVTLDDGNAYSADYVFLTTGHGKRKPTALDRRYTDFVARHETRNPALAYFASPYPIAGLARIPATATVAVQGFGLTAHDVISALTAGRGGTYVERDGDLHYVPSGNEPRIRLLSRNGLPFATRGINQKGLAGRHHARFFTAAAVAQLRRAASAGMGDGRLDFQREVLPLIFKEMAYAYRAAAQCRDIDVSSFVPTADELRLVEAIMWPGDGRAFETFDDYRAFFNAALGADLTEARRGNLTSPIKAATDVLRDTREALRTAVEYGGLTAASHKFFIEEFNTATNRVAFGPPIQRSLEYVALHRAGLIDVAGGPGALIVVDDDRAQFRIDAASPAYGISTFADVLVAARLDAYSPLTDDSRLTENLVARGMIRPFRNDGYHPGGIDIDADLHPVDTQGVSQSRIWAIGFLVEGAHFYTHALPRPLIDSRQTRDAERCVLGLFEAISATINTATRSNALAIDARAFQ